MQLACTNRLTAPGVTGDLILSLITNLWSALAAASLLRSVLRAMLAARLTCALHFDSQLVLQFAVGLFESLQFGTLL